MSENRFVEKILELEPDTELTLEATKNWGEVPHRFGQKDVLAIKAAVVTKRPLLIRGEPGIGKSQLARAVASFSGVPFINHVINSRCESTDLLFKYDAVSRLAQAQVLGNGLNSDKWKEDLAEKNFLRPGPMWWAFNWSSAQKQAKVSCPGTDCSSIDECCNYCCEPEIPETADASEWATGDGCIVLIDEIDKADADLPNGLLESLGNAAFAVPHTGEVICLQESTTSPLIIITTNEERELPAAFMRRCLVLQMSLGEDEKEVTSFLVKRGKDHFNGKLDLSVLKKSAELLCTSRRDASAVGPSIPGASEYLDLLNAVHKLFPDDTELQKQKLDELAEFTFRKNVREHRA